MTEDLASVLQRARQQLDAGARREAVAALLSVADEAGRLPEPRPPSVQAHEYVRIARQERQAGHEQLALDILETASGMTPLEAAVLYEIGQTHAAAGDIDRALAQYDAAIALDPGVLDAHWQRGVLLEGRGEIDEALAAWQASDLSRDARRHSLYLAAALKSPRFTSERLRSIQEEWARLHAQPR